MILQIVDFLSGALLAEVARYLFVSYIKHKLEPSKAVIFQNLDSVIKLFIETDSFQTANLYTELIESELNKFDNLKSSLFLLKPVKNILVNQIRKQFDPFTLMREPATDEN
jgi:hypothetical protein